MKNVSISVLLLLLLAVCGDEDNEKQAAIAACENLADAMATRLVECAEQRSGTVLQPSERQQAYQAAYDKFVLDSVGDSCDDIKSVRDSTSLYDECLPALDSLPCDDVLNGNLPAVCQKQLIRYE